MSRSQDSRVAAIKAAASHAEFIAKSCEEPADPAVLPGADAVLSPRVHPMRSVDVAQLGPPAPQPGGHVRDPQAVTPAVLGLGQAQLGAGVRPLPAGEDAYAGQPSSWSPPGPSRSRPVSSVSQ